MLNEKVNVLKTDLIGKVQKLNGMNFISGVDVSSHHNNMYIPMYIVAQCAAPPCIVPLSLTPVPFPIP